MDYPKFSVLKTEYGPVNGITIKEYHEVVHWGWYVVKARLVERYEIMYKDYDEQGFDAWYCKVWKEFHEDFGDQEIKCIRKLKFPINDNHKYNVKKYVQGINYLVKKSKDKLT